MSNYLQAELHQRLLDADDHCCGCCRTTQANSGQPMVVDHIVPQSQGGETSFENLCFLAVDVTNLKVLWCRQKIL